MKDKRPVNLDLTKFKFPLPALTSIAHRVMGVVVFFGFALLLYGLDKSLSGEEGFYCVKALLDGVLVKLVVWGLVSALLYHLVAGCKHLLMDLGIGETLEGALVGAKATIIVSALLILLAGVWLW